MVDQIDELSGPIRWRLHLPVPPARVYEVLSTDAGRATFWAQTETHEDGTITFRFSNGTEFRGREIENHPGKQFAVEYFGGVAVFELGPDGRGGTDLLLVHTGLRGAEWVETHAGWLNVLFPLKAMLVHGVDLRTHDPERTWDDGFVDG